jgi:hypothetical protein
MSWNEHADAVRARVDDLALSAASLEDWKRVDADLFGALVEVQRLVTELRTEMLELVKAETPSWGWVEKQRVMLELREAMDDLRVLRMCVQSRIFELEAGAEQRYSAAD